MATPVKVGVAGGEYMESVVILEWTVKTGDAISAGQHLVTVETAKAATEIEAPCEGFLTAILAEPGTEVSLTETLGLIGADTADTAYEGDEPATDHAPVADEASLQATTSETVSAAESLSPPTPGGRTVASPAARRAAAMAGIDISRITPTSPTGRMKLRDLASATIMRAEIPLVPAGGLSANEAGPLKVYLSGTKTGIPVLMLHGFGADAMSWFPIERALARTHPIVRFDLPNHGKSPRRRMTRFADLAREIVDAFDALHLYEVHVLGHSLGGACALALADIRPRKVASLALLAPGGLGPVINGEFAAGLARASRPESLEQWLKLSVADTRLISPEFVGAAMSSRVDPALRAAQAQMANDLFPDGTQGFDLRPALQRVECPMRVIWGKADAVIPWQQALSAPGRAGLHLFEATGHVPQMERPEDVVAILEALFAASGGKQ